MLTLFRGKGMKLYALPLQRAPACPETERMANVPLQTAVAA